MKIDFQKVGSVMEGCKDFSGVVYLKEGKNVVFSRAYGYANRSEGIENSISTRFGIASGCKLFTSLAICQLITEGKLSLESYLKDCVDVPFPNFHPDIAIHHLLTHTSGVPDYFDEEVMEDFSELWAELPMYKVRSCQDFLPLFQYGNMDFSPGERFKYNNSGFILLGLILEHQTKKPFPELIQERVFQSCQMNHSGYFPFDKLPKNTAQGYIRDQNGEWKTNIYSLPVIGGADGGAYTTAEDLSKLWAGLSDNSLLPDDMTNELLTPRVQVDGDLHYGYGIWIVKKGDEVSNYYITGQDPGLSMLSAFYPKLELEVTVLGNTELGTWDIVQQIRKFLG